MTLRAVLWIALLAAAALPSAAQAQVAAAPGSSGTIPDKVAPGSAPDTDVSKGNGTLSDKLSTTNGVIHPEGSVDPKIEKPVSPTGAMPVIPPPGSPGGATDVQPK